MPPAEMEMTAEQKAREEFIQSGGMFNFQMEEENE